MVIIVAVIGLIFEKSVITPRYKGLKWMYLLTLIAITFTICCLITHNNFSVFPLWVAAFFRTMFFVTSPLLALLYVFYSITIVHNKTKIKDLFLKYKWYFVPYIIYLVIVFTNSFHGLIFTFSPTVGYIKGKFSIISYVIAFVYLVLILVLSYKNRKSSQKDVLVIICLNFITSSIIFGAQLFFPYVQLSGLACAIGLLVVHFYIISVSKNVDPLTELYDRKTMTKHLTKLCENKTPFSMAVFSLRNFKSINERFGLELGDMLLCEITARLKKILPYKSIYRYGGDEFAYIKIGTDDEIFNIEIQYAISAVCKEFNLEQNVVALDAVYARVDYPAFGVDLKEIISAMDYSISTVKKNVGETNYIYDLSITEKMKRRNYIVERLKKAIANDGFEVHYQPIYSSSVNCFPMAEALIRLKQTDEAFISPGEFIPIAEELGLVSRLTYIVLQKTCENFKSLINKYGENLMLKNISINFPYVHFLKKSTVNEVLEIVDKFDLPHSCIKMELTERTLVSDTRTTKEIMDELIEHGFEFELDDFGVEYSNFSMFFNIPVKIIKFDRSLVSSVISGPRHRKFFESLIAAIKDMDVQVVMEGVEDEETLNYLLSCGCDYIQGYVFTKPLNASEFENFLISKKSEIVKL